MCSTGGSAWMTRATSSTWIPRAAMSVATSVWARPLWKASMLRVRAFWLRLPCSSTVGTPLRLSWRASALAPCLVRVKTRVRPGALARSTRIGSRWSREMCRTWWSMVATGDCAESAWWVTGELQEPLDHDVDRLVQGRGEQQPLTIARRPVEQTAYGGKEAEVGHVVGLVEDGDLDRAERAVALADQVLEPAGAGHDDVDAAAQALHLGVLPDAAEDGAGAEAGCLAPTGRGPGRSGRPARGSARGSARGVLPGAGCGPRLRAGRRGGAGTRRSCRSRCGPGRARRGRPGSPAASLPGSGSG